MRISDWSSDLCSSDLPSPYEADGGENIGKLPRALSKPELKALGHPESPIKAIRAKCLDCDGQQHSEVRKCTATGCPLRSEERRVEKERVRTCRSRRWQNH